MNNFKKIMIIAVACIMVMSLVACDDAKTSQTVTPTTAPTQTDTPPEQAVVPGIDGFKSFSKKVHILYLYTTDQEGYPAVDDNYRTQWIQAEFGTSII